MMQHELVDNTLIRDANGITARCTCGWVSAGHFSALAASAAFHLHQETFAKAQPQGDDDEDR